MKLTLRFLIYTLANSLLFFSLQTSAQSNPTDIPTKVDAMIKKMTLEEKVGQMMQLDFYTFFDTKGKDTFLIDPKKLAEIVKKYNPGSFLNTPRAQQNATWVQLGKQIQQINLKNSRLKIPIIYGVDHIHGASYVLNATLFPHNINTAATFNPSFAASAGASTALESSDLGHHWVFAPILDIGRNPYFPRFYETWGEDPFLASKMGEAYVKALQENKETAPIKQAGCAKHFIGYSDPRSGWDRTPAEISDQNIQELFRPSFQAAVDAGIKTFMICSGEINGIPVHASYPLLTGLLRDQMGFKGVTVTDWEDIILLHKSHRIAENEKEATYLAIMAGIDMSMTPYTMQFYEYLIELVKEGRIPMSRIDLSVGRILALKYDLGLFDKALVMPKTDRLAKNFGLKKTKEASLNSARESIVLIKNNQKALPLDINTRRIILLGPNANVKRSLCGGWSYSWQGKNEKLFPSSMLTVYQALRKEFPATTIEFIADTISKNESSKANFMSRASRADAIIYLGGEYPYAEGEGNINDLRIDAAQANDLQLIGSSGKKSILILLEGRPRVIAPSLVQNLQAILFAGLPGTEGAKAITEILSGRTNPSGKMSFTYPSHVGHTVQYHKKYTEKKRMHQGFDTTYTLADFGHGLSYSQFKYLPIVLSDTIIENGKVLKASITVLNEGKISGKEAVLWYLFDEYRSTSPPVKMLKYFEKVNLSPGEQKTVTFLIKPEQDLWFRSAKGDKILEKGSFRLFVGDQTARFNYR